MKTQHGKSQAAFPRESSLSPFKPCLDEICIIFTPRASSLHARHANSPSVHPHAKHSTLEPAVQGLPSKTHGYPASLPGPRRVFWGTGCMGAHLSENTTCHRHHEHPSPTYCRLGKMQQRVLLGGVGCQQPIACALPGATTNPNPHQTLTNPSSGFWVLQHCWNQ